MPKIYLSPSSQNENAYATGNTNEQTQCRKIAEACAVFLKKAGLDVRVGNSGTMYTRTADSNGWGADLHIPIHTNAYNGRITGGSQVYLLKLTGEHKKVGQAVLDRLAQITPGKSHEKLVANNSFYEINNARAITVYCECEFHDTKTGSDFIINNTKQIGEAIAKGICDYYDIDVSEKVTNTTSTDGTLYVVRAGAFKDKVNAEKRVNDLKKAGFDSYIKKE